jgi:mycofactocin precursor
METLAPEDLIADVDLDEEPAGLEDDDADLLVEDISIDGMCGVY